MAANLSLLPDSAQKQYSKLFKSIKEQEDIIEKCELRAKESPSDKVRRARDGVVYHEKQLREHDDIWRDKIEREVEALRVKLTNEAERMYENKRKYLSDAEEKLEKEESIKPGRQIDAERTLVKLKEEMERLTAMFKPSPTTPLTQAPITQTEESDEYKEARAAFFANDAPLPPLTFLDNYHYSEPPKGGYTRKLAQYGAVASLESRR